MSRNFILFKFLVLSTILFSLQGGCGGDEEKCPSVCSPERRYCNSEADGLLICAKDPISKCYHWISVPCKSGAKCVTSASSALCSFGVKESCQNKKFKKGCLDNRIYWFDECGNPSFEVLACPDGTVCSGGKCKYPSDNCPKDSCQEGDTRCKGKDRVEKCIEGVDGCPVWKEIERCPVGQFCSSGSCVESCKAICSEGESRCNGDRVEICKRDSNGCVVWVVKSKCAPDKRCKEGSCVSECSNSCQKGEKRCSSDKRAIEICEVGDSGCSRWKHVKSCAAGEICLGGICKATCKNECREGDKRCDNNAVAICKKNSDSCLVWSIVNRCGSGEVCRDGSCEPKCGESCSLGAKRCSGNFIQECKVGTDGCSSWQQLAQCPAGQVCYGGRCVSQKDPSQRTEQEVCSRWKSDYPSRSQTNWKNDGSQCDPGSISQGAIDDAIRRTNLYRWLVGLAPVQEDKQYTKGTQACAIIQANNGLNHRPPPSSTCYNKLGARVAGQSNLSAGVGHPADMVSQFISDRGVPSLGHRLWVLNSSLGKTGFGVARGKGPYRAGGCMFVFDYSNRVTPPDFIAFPSPGPFPIQAVYPGRWFAVEDWSVVSRKYKLSSIKSVKITRLNDGATFSVNTRNVGLGYFAKGIAWKVPFKPKAGENYKVEVGNLFSYTVKFFNCR